MKNTQDLTGQKFGHLTAVRKTEERKNGYIVYECQCDCGRPDCRHIIYRPSRLLKHTQVTDCGGVAALTHARRFKDLTGKKFGMLTVLKEDGKQGKSTRWLCACECGNLTHATTHQLIAGKKASCGCRQNSFEIKDWTETDSHPAMRLNPYLHSGGNKPHKCWDYAGFCNKTHVFFTQFQVVFAQKPLYLQGYTNNTLQVRSYEI